ncbi:MAG: ATP-binding protein [Bacteroidetes Order II. Incertae sedis bacterium]|nr:ATP-binding protein [Bacteroidetes Order II. bacterium]
MNTIPRSKADPAHVKVALVHLLLASIAEHASVILAMLQACALDFEWPPELSERVYQAGTEGFINGMEHGNGYQPEKKIAFTLIDTPSRVELVIQDQGRGFNPKTLPDPLVPENLLKASGRGIFLIRHWADEVQFEDEGRRLVLQFFKTA